MTTDLAILDAPAVAALLGRPDPPTVLDASFTLTGGGRAAYDSGHIPGAVFVDLDTDIAGPPGAGGRHPLPDPELLQAALRRLGVRQGHQIIVYERGGVPVGSAARVWWTLRWAGHRQVAVLDGGFAAWLESGGASTTEATEAEEPPPGDFAVRPGGVTVWTARDVAAAGESGAALVDARVGERFRGEVEPIDPVAGHIPGAVNLPVAALVDGRGLLKSPDELRAAFTCAIGREPDRDEPVGAYCGSGITAAQTALALHRAGLQPALYVGSWSDWITDDTRPVATG